MVIELDQDTLMILWKQKVEEMESLLAKARAEVEEWQLKTESSRVVEAEVERDCLEEKNIELRAEVERLPKLEAELRLRRKQMSAFPFCPDHRDKVHGKPCRECEVERLRKENDELDQLFELQHKRSMEAIAMWRRAHPGNELVQPDLGVLLTWLMDEIKQLEKRWRRTK